MADVPTPRPTDDLEWKSAWMVAQQAAQMVGEVGVGAGGIAGAVQVAKGMIGGSKSGGDTANPQQGQNPGKDK